MITVDEQLRNWALLKPPGVCRIDFGHFSRLAVNRKLTWKGPHGSPPFSWFKERTAIFRQLFVGQPSEDRRGKKSLDKNILLQNQWCSGLPSQRLDALLHECRKVLPGNGPHISLDIRQAFDGGRVAARPIET